jgi:two-component system nitrogen regulation response regulator GlnG
VLVVDDEALIRWSLSEGLTDAGYRVHEASCGAEALTFVSNGYDGPLVVLLDLRLSDVRDLSLMRAIRTRRPDAPVIMMSAHGTTADANDAQEAGVFRFVNKPFDVREMVDLVGQAWTSQTRSHGARA